MTTFSATCIWAHHIKALLTTWNLYLQGLKLWPHLPAAHQQLLLLRHPNPNTLFHHIISSSTLNLLSLPPSIYIKCLPQPPTKVPPTEPSNETLHKNSVEPISIRTLNMVHKGATNIPPVPHLSKPAPCKNSTQFKSLNIHIIFGCGKFRNQKHHTVSTNEIIVNSGLIPSTIGSFSTIANPPKGKKSRIDASTLTNSIWT